MSKRSSLNVNEKAALPKGDICKCPKCEGDTLTVSQSNTRPTKVYCTECDFCDSVKAEAPKVEEPKKDA